MNRVAPIEGLRAWLALWVLLGHVMGFSGLDAYHNFPAYWQTLAARLLGDGSIAVQMFMIISGFVIFFLLDHKREAYAPFLLRRFMRLYPLYIVLLTVAIFTDPLTLWVINHSEGFMSHSARVFHEHLYQLNQEHWGWYVALHATMLHGFIPDAWLGPYSSYAFLGPAWSISVEWQFYLLAPLAFALAVGSLPGRIALAAGLLALYLVAICGIIPPSAAFLPFYLPFFAVGCLSYFAHKKIPETKPDRLFLASLLLTAAVILLGLLTGNTIWGLPIILWIPFFGLLCENPKSIVSGLLLPLFNHPFIQFLGAISYGIYLSHDLVKVAMQYVLITLAPGMGYIVHFCALLILTLAGTIALSALLHRYIEIPGIELGKKWTRRR